MASRCPADAQFITDGTTDYGKTKINVALGVARVNGKMILNDGDPCLPAEGGSALIEEAASHSR